MYYSKWLQWWLHDKSTNFDLKKSKCYLKVTAISLSKERRLFFTIQSHWGFCIEYYSLNMYHAFKTANHIHMWWANIKQFLILFVKVAHLLLTPESDVSSDRIVISWLFIFKNCRHPGAQMLKLCKFSQFDYHHLTFLVLKFHLQFSCAEENWRSSQVPLLHCQPRLVCFHQSVNKLYHSI